MPAKSENQQQLMAMALRYKRGQMKNASEKVKAVAKNMSEKELEKYAGTSHKGLPKKVGESKIKVSELQQMVQDAVEEVMSERLSVKKLTPEQKQRYIESISRFNEYSSVIHRSKQLPEVVSEITTLVEFATKNMVEESGDWFEGVSYNRKSRRLKESLKDFRRISERITKLQRTLESVYENIGRNLGNFYEIKNDGANIK